MGDWVLLDGIRIVALLPRRTAIKRGAAGEHYHQQVIAANIDTVFIVCGLDADFNPRRIERYLLLVGGGGAEPVKRSAACATSSSTTRAAGRPPRMHRPCASAST
ncbi:GTPase RsgA, partial [Mesorhizobium sp. M1C.F.Ca.ET.176.01.1.1]|uniref:GTPase RsgA n=1 Tax=Mesorhizobium sp. M1C.F.Ca.ET.176.01.1.1 TaxID=2563922 RepID=UPI0032AFDFC1